MADSSLVPQKGYRFCFPGAPAPRIVDAPAPDRVRLSLMHPSETLVVARVNVGDRVRTGQVVAESEAYPSIKLIAPVTGRVTHVEETHGLKRRLKPGYIDIEREGDDEWAELEGASTTPEEIPGETARRLLADGGLWPLIRELPESGPAPAEDAAAQAIVVKCVHSEPFRPRGHALLMDRLDAFVLGLGLLQRAAADYARTHLVLTNPQASLAKQIQQAADSRAWITPHYAERLYPIENDGYLFRLLFPDQLGDAAFRAWFVDVQTVLQIADCLGRGRPAVERVVSVAGPGVRTPEHVRVRVGAPVRLLLDGRLDPGEHRVVRGGLLTGRRIDPDAAWVGPADDAFTVLPEGREREFMSFVRPGGDRDSFSRAFLSSLWPQRPRTLHTNLRGEPRPCVSCGFCEDACPVGLMPHWLHKCLEADQAEEAEQMGLHLCVGCGLCTYVCPSKIELRAQFREARRRLAEENA